MIGIAYAILKGIGTGFLFVCGGMVNGGGGIGGRFMVDGFRDVDRHWWRGGWCIGGRCVVDRGVVNYRGVVNWGVVNWGVMNRGVVNGSMVNGAMVNWAMVTNAVGVRSGAS